MGTHNSNLAETACSNAGWHQPTRGGVGVPPIPSPNFNKAWQRERVQRLARICRCLDRGSAQGKPVSRMLIKHAWRWKGRFYKADPARPIRFRLTTLRRIYYAWKSGGRVPAAIALRYRSGNSKLALRDVLTVARRCASFPVGSYRAAWDHVGPRAATADACRKATPAHIRTLLVAVCAQRRNLKRLEREAARAIERIQAEHGSLAT